nr:MAG TPA: hypothetical protein [Caudoviricetes sp.]
MFFWHFSVIMHKNLLHFCNNSVATLLLIFPVFPSIIGNITIVTLCKRFYVNLGHKKFIK